MANEPPVWNSSQKPDEKKSYRAQALAYLKRMQEEAKNKKVDYATKYRQITETEDLEDAYDILKEKIEKMTTNP